MSCHIYEKMRGLVIWAHISNLVKLTVWRTDRFSHSVVFGAVKRVGWTDWGQTERGTLGYATVIAPLGQRNTSHHWLSHSSSRR